MVKKEADPQALDVNPDLKVTIPDSVVEIRAVDQGASTDNFFRAVIAEMLNDTDISLKTEYVNQNENLAAVKLEFLAHYCNMPMMAKFINYLEIKRVSLGRKSRIELIKAFEKRDEDVQSSNRLNMMKQLMGG